MSIREKNFISCDGCKYNKVGISCDLLLSSDCFQGQFINFYDFYNAKHVSQNSGGSGTQWP